MSYVICFRNDHKDGVVVGARNSPPKDFEDFRFHDVLGGWPSRFKQGTIFIDRDPVDQEAFLHQYVRVAWHGVPSAIPGLPEDPSPEDYGRCLQRLLSTPKL